MKVRKYTASSMPEVMKKIREELGDEAVILNSKEVATGGFFGFFTKKQIEVVAAVDPDTTVAEAQPQPPKVQPKQIRPQKPITYQLERGGEEEQSSEVLDEIRELKAAISRFPRQHASKESRFSNTLQQLEEHDLDPALLERIEQDLTIKYDAQDQKNIAKETVAKWTKESVYALLKDASFGGFHYETKILNLVGPTGVGKTTTIAKIGAKAVLQDDKKVAFITTDTFRIAAIEQLKTYASLLNVPVEVAYNIEDFKKAKEKFAHYDLILVDSAGRNYQDDKYIKELQQVVDFNDEMTTYLVLALTAKYRDVKKIIDQFEHLPIEKVVFTKLDETASYGTLLNVIVTKGKGIAYITNGQNVPDDVMEGSKELIVDLLIEGSS